MQAATSIRAAAPLNHTPAVDVCASLDLAHRPGLHPAGPGALAGFLLRSLTARYDNAALSPRATGFQPDAHADPALITDLRAWCMTGLGSGRTPFWRPWALPDVAQRLSVALLTGPAPTAQIEALARQLDRDDELAALAAQSRRQAIALKLAVKWQELWWWRARHPRQAWDCGWLREDVSALASFSPRRPTLVVAQALSGPRDRHRPAAPAGCSRQLPPPSAAAHAGARNARRSRVPTHCGERALVHRCTAEPCWRPARIDPHSNAGAPPMPTSKPASPPLP